MSRAGERGRTRPGPGAEEARATEEEGNGGDVIVPAMTDVSVSPSPIDVIIEIYYR